MGVLLRAGTVVGAGREVGHAQLLVGRDAADSLVGHGDGVDARPAGFRVVDHGIAARIVLALLAGRRVALLGAEVDPAALADVVAGVDLGLGAEALPVGPDRLVRIDHRPHPPAGGVKLDEP